MAILQSGIELWTFQDVVDHLIDTFEYDRTGRTPRNARRAIRTAYRDLPHRHRWSYFERRIEVTTVANQTTGTVTYDHAGGTYDRELTLSGATWPEWARYGRIILGNETYIVEDRKSDTVLTLAESSNPGADLAVGTSYNIYRSLYQLPVGTRRVSAFVEPSGNDCVYYAEPDELVEDSVGYYTPAQPVEYTFRQHEDYIGGMAIEFHPPPNNARTYVAMAEMRPRDLTTEKESTGTITVSAGSTAVAGSGTAFADKHAGDVMRFTSDGSNEPTGLAGDDTSNTPYDEQHTIKSVTSATALVLETPAVAAYAGKKFTISSPVDIEHGAMLTLFQRMCEAEFATLSRMEESVVTAAEWRVRDALIKAKGAAYPNRNINGPSDDRSDWEMKDWAIVA